MTEFAYTTVTGKIKSLLEKVRTVGIPKKADGSWLKIVGFTSSNDRSLVGILKFIGFIDQNGIPTSAWSNYRGAKHKFVLGQAIKSGYSELYSVYSDAHQRSNTELSHVFSTSSSAGSQVIAKTVATFKALAAEAEFSANDAPPQDEGGTNHSTSSMAETVQQPSGAFEFGGSPAVHIDIQIHISPESSPQQIEKIFESMAKHLYRKKGD